MTEKDLHRNSPSVRDNRTVLLHFSPVTPNQQLKQSFQTFAALPVDEITQQTSQLQTAVQDELSVGSDRPGVIAKDFFQVPHLVSCDSCDPENSSLRSWMTKTRFACTDRVGVIFTLLETALWEHARIQVHAGKTKAWEPSWGSTRSL